MEVTVRRAGQPLVVNLESQAPGDLGGARARYREMAAGQDEEDADDAEPPPYPGRA